MKDLVDVFNNYSDFAAIEEESYESRRHEQLDQMMNNIDSLPDLGEISPAELTDDELIELQLAKESSLAWRKNLKSERW